MGKDDNPIGSEIGGWAPRHSGRGLVFACALVVIVTVLGLVAWTSLRASPAVSPPQVEQDQLVLVCAEFRLQERQLTATLDLPKGTLAATGHALEQDPESQLWVSYGGKQYPALFIQVTAIRTPQNSPIDRLVLTAFLDKTQPPPDPATQRIAAGLEIAGHFVNRSGPVRLIVEGVERVTR